MAQPNYPPVDQTSYPLTAAPPQPSYPPTPAAVIQPNYPTTQQPSSTYYASASAYPPQPTYFPPDYPLGPGPQSSYKPLPVPALRPTQAAIAQPNPVVGLQYCLPRPVDLVIVRKLMTLTDDFIVTDVEKNTMFKVKGKIFSLHDQRFLLDAAGAPILTLRHKMLTAHSRWQVFRGGSSHPADLIFNARTSSVIQLKTKLNVYLANRISEAVCDFKVEGSWTDRSCVIYVGESTTIAAQMYKKDTAQSFFLGKDTFMVTVYPNIDYAFVVAIILILDAINSSSDVV